MRAADECKDQLNKTFTHSHLTEKAIALGKCADFTAKMAEFLQLHGKLLEQAGKILGIAVPAVEFAHEVGQLHEDMKSLATYTRSNPESALKAAKILDERQRATLQRLSACQVRFADVFKGLH